MTEEDIAEMVGVPVGELRIARFADFQVVELDAPIGENDDMPMEVEGYFYADDKVMQEDQLKKINIAVSHLKKQQQIALTKRYGLDGHAPCQLDDVGLAIGKTRERARQVLKQGEAVLRKKYKSLLLR
jgi:DNA-directed RNA polymerase sigma subunit (sigma70/sigma32)